MNSPNNTNQQKNDQNILVNDEYNQDVEDLQRIGDPIEINDEYYHDQNQEDRDQEEDEDQQQEQQNDNDEDQYQEENEEGDDNQEYQEDQQNHQQLNDQEKLQQHYLQQQQIQNYLYQQNNQRINNPQFYHPNNHIREQTEEDQMYDDQIMSDRRKQNNNYNQQEEDQDDENDNDDQGIDQNENEQSQNDKYLSQLQNKANLQQKRYQQPQQFIEYKTGEDSQELDDEQNQNKNDGQMTQSEVNQENTHAQNHYYDHGNKQYINHNNNQKNFEKKNNNHHHQHHQKSASGNLSSYLDSNSNIEEKSNIMNRIKQDESQLETSQANESVNQNINTNEDQYQKKQHLLDSPGNMELIKHSKYYQKYLNGESLNESYSILPSQNQNLLSLQNSTSFGDPKGLIAALDPSLQNNELYIHKMKLFESNSKLMQEMSKNRTLTHENQEMKLKINNLEYQLQQSQNSIKEYQSQLSQQQSTHNHQQTHLSQQQSQQQVMMNTFSSPLKSPTFEPQSESIVQKNAQLEEEISKNYDLRQDLESLRTRLLQEMNSSNQFQQQLKEQDKIIKELQYDGETKNKIIQDRTDEIRRLNITCENLRNEIQNLNLRLGKAHQAKEEFDRQKRDLHIEIGNLKAENKQQQSKLVNYNQDNLRLFSEIQILKQKLDKSDSQVAVSQSQLYNHKQEIHSQQQNLITSKQHQTIVDKFQIELNELRSNLIATSKQLEERNDYLSVRLEEAEKLNKQTHGQKQQNTTVNQNKNTKMNSPPKYRNESELEYQQRQLDLQMYEKQQQLERQYQQKQLELITQYASNQNSIQEINDQQYQQQDQQFNQKTVKQKQHIIHSNNRIQTNSDEYQQQFNTIINNKGTIQSEKQQQQQSYQSSSQNINPNQYQSNYEINQKRDNYIDQQIPSYYINKQQQQQQVTSVISPQAQSQKQIQPISDNRYNSPPQRNTIGSNSQLNNQPLNNNLFYQDLEEEKQKLQKQNQYIPIGVTSVNEDNYISNTTKIRDLDTYLNQLLQKKKLAESELLKLEENKRKSSMIIIQKQELEQRIEQYSLDISNVKGQLRALHALK